MSMKLREAAQCTGLITDLAVNEVIALRLLLVLHILGLSLFSLVRPDRCSVTLISLTKGFGSVFIKYGSGSGFNPFPGV
jgi:hypothetical protein